MSNYCTKMKILLIDHNIHPKNRHGMYLLPNTSLKCVSWQEFSTMDVQKDDYDCVFSPGAPVDVTKYPDVRFLFGPHFGIFPNEKVHMIKGPYTTYVVPSDWVKNLYNSFDICNDVDISVLPFAVDIHKFMPVKEKSERDCVFVYYKNRSYYDLNIVCDELSKRGINYKIFRYWSYSESDYIDYLKRCKFGVWIGAHESQGFALQEALAMDVPLFVWSVRCMSQEYGQHYAPHEATTVSHWDDRCGRVIYNKEEIPSGLDAFLKDVDADVYKPRSFIEEVLSPDACERRLKNIISKDLRF